MLESSEPRIRPRRLTVVMHCAAAMQPRLWVLWRTVVGTCMVVSVCVLYALDENYLAVVARVSTPELPEKPAAEVTTASSTSRELFISEPSHHVPDKKKHNTTTVVYWRTYPTVTSLDIFLICAKDGPDSQPNTIHPFRSRQGSLMR